MRISNIPEDLTSGIHSTKVIAYSENTSITSEFWVDVYVPPTYELTLNLNETSANKYVDPGESTTFNFTLKNDGNKKDYVNVKYGFKIQAVNWTILLNTQEDFFIEQDEIKNVQIEVSAPADQSYPFIAPIFLNCSSQYNTSVYQNTTVNAKTQQVSDINLDMPLFRSLNLTTFKASLPMTVSNEGNGEDTINFNPIPYEMFPDGETWSYDFEYQGASISSITITSQNTKKVYLNLTGPNNPGYSIFNLYINASSDNDPSITVSKEVTVSVGEFYNVDITRLASQTQHPYPGDTVSIKIKTENVGNTDDSFHFYADVPSEAEGWTSSFDPEYLVIPTEGVDYSYFNVTVDNDAQQGTYLFWIYCYPSKDEEELDRFNFTVKVKRKYEVELLVSPPTKLTDPGISADFLFTVQNKGTGSCNVTMNATMLPSYEWYMTAKVTPSSFELETSTASQLVWVNITPSATNPLAPMNDTTGIPITVNADIVEREGWPDTSKNVKVKINQTYDVEVYSETLYINIEPGKSDSFNITIKNEGNGEDSFGIYAGVPAHPKWTVDLAKSNTETLNMDGEEKILVTIEIPSTESSVSDNITINVTSRGDDAIFEVEMVEVTVKAPDRGVSITSPDNYKEGRPGTTINFTFNVRNTGTDNDFYNLEVISTDPANVANWINPPDPWQTSNLEPDNAEMLYLDVKIPSDEDPSPPYATIEIEASSDKTPEELDTISISVEVEQVFKLKVEPVQNTVSIDPGENGTVTIDIRNQGSGTDDVEVDTDWKSANLLYIDVDKPTFTVNKNGVEKVELTIGIADDPNPDEQSITVTITATSTKDTETSPAEHSDTITVEIIMVKLEVKTTDDTEDVTPNLSGDKATVEYDIQIWNKGLEADSFDLEATKVNHAQYVKLSSDATSSISPDSSSTITVTIEIDNKKSKSSATDTQNPHLITRITATSNKDDAKSEYIEVTTRILQAYGVELTVPDDTLETGETFVGNNRVVTFDIAVKNIGTGEDDIELSLSGPNEDWGSLSASPVTLAKDAKETVTLTVKIPKDEPQDDYPITIRAISKGDDTIWDDTEDEYDDLIVTVKVTQYYDVYIPSPTVTYTVLPGETISYPDFTVKNRGNGEDDIRIETEGSNDLEWSPKTIDKTLGKSGSVDSSSSVVITTTIPTDMIEGTYYINITLKSDTPTGYIEHIDRLTFTIIVEQVYDIDISVEDSSKDGDPGDRVKYRLKIKNKGNGVDTFYLSTTGTKDSWAEFEDNEDSITLSPDDSTVIDFIVEIPSLTQASDLEDIEADSYKITIKAESDGDDDVDDSVQVTVTVDAIYKIEFEYTTTATEESRMTADANKQDGEKFNFIVKNKGNSDDTITMGTSNVPEYWLISFNYQSFTLNPDETKEIVATIKFSDDVKESTMKYFVITAKSSDGDKFTTEKVYVDVTQYSFEFVEVKISGDAVAGDSVTITATLKNKGSGPAEDIEVKFFDGTKILGTVKITDLDAGDEEDVQFDWKVSEGKHSLKAEVENPNGKKVTEQMDSFEAKTELIPSEYFIWIIVIVAIILLIIGLIVGVMSQRRGVPPYLREEIDEVKREIAAGKSIEDVRAERDMRRGKEFGKAPPVPLKKEEGLEKEGPAPKEGRKGGKVVKIKCPKCDKIQTVTTPKRPLEFGCDGCGMKLVLKK